MKTLGRTPMLILVFALAVALPLQACNTVAGVGKDVSSGADAVTDPAEKNKTY